VRTFERGHPHCCYTNAARHLLRFGQRLKDLRYVEGTLVGEHWTVNHAWLTDETGKIYEVTIPERTADGRPILDAPASAYEELCRLSLVEYLIECARQERQPADGRKLYKAV
jgi:hypothetical protein